MTSQTSHFGLQKLNVGDSMAGSGNGYAFSFGDRDFIDNLLYQASTGHRHNGATPAVANPSTGVNLSLTATSGSLPAGIRVYYEYTLVDPNGFESSPSSETFYDIPAGISTPGALALATAGTGGHLIGGGYYYVVSAYKTTNTSETLPSNAAYIPVSAVTSTNTVTLTFPTLPTGASGWNIYRRAPGEAQYSYLASVASGPTTYVDDGTVAANFNRTIPTVNSTGSTNTINVTLPGATPVVPAGYQWKLYRTFSSGVYANSLVTTVTGGATTYADTGGPTSQGSPPVASQFHSNPPPINLATDVTGVLPAANGGSANPITTLGDLIYGFGATPPGATPARLPIGSQYSGLFAGTGTGATPYWGPTPTQLMTAVGDIVYASAAHVLARLGIGAQWQELISNGSTPTWGNGAIAAVTAVGDIVYATAAHVLGRLGIGAQWQELVASGGATPIWTNGALSTVTATGDLLYASAAHALARLAAGSQYQELQMSAGATPIWAPSAAGIATTTGDLVYASAAHVLARLGVGTNAQMLIGGATPTYAPQSALNPNAWSTYTPALPTGGTTLWNIGNGSINGHYRYLDAKTLALRIVMSIGSTTVVGDAALTLSLPSGVTSAASDAQELTLRYSNASSAYFVGVAEIAPNSTVIGTITAPSSSTTSQVTTFASGANNPGAGASLAFQGIIEIQ